MSPLKDPASQNLSATAWRHALFPTMTQNSLPLIGTWEVAPDIRPCADTTWRSTSSMGSALYSIKQSVSEDKYKWQMQKSCLVSLCLCLTDLPQIPYFLVLCNGATGGQLCLTDLQSPCGNVYSSHSITPVSSWPAVSMCSGDNLIPSKGRKCYTTTWSTSTGGIIFISPTRIKMTSWQTELVKKQSLTGLICSLSFSLTTMWRHKYTIIGTGHNYIYSKYGINSEFHST